MMSYSSTLTTRQGLLFAEQPAFESNGDIVFTYNVNVTGCSAADAETAYEASVANYDPVFMYG